MKVKGSELIQFMNDGWPQPEDDWYWDHDLFEEPDPDQTYDTDEIGPLLYQGSGPTDVLELDLASLIRKWRKSRDFDVFTISVKKVDTEKVRAVLADLGVRI